jgi:hypothetical protein
MAKTVGIRNWEPNWNRTFRDAERLFFSTSIGNVASYIIENIDYLLSDRRNQLGAHPRETLSLIIEKASSHDTEARILHSWQCRRSSSS